MPARFVVVVDCGVIGERRIPFARLASARQFAERLAPLLDATVQRPRFSTFLIDARTFYNEGKVGTK